MLRILKLGWEFPPNNLGGLGVACEGLVRGLTHAGVSVLLVLPQKQSSSIIVCAIIGTDTIPLLHELAIDSLLVSYSTSQSYHDLFSRHGGANLYGSQLFAEIERYAHVVRQVATREHFDIIHAHDWMSFKAGILAREVSGKPLVVHVHATEFDRTGGNGVHQYVYDMESWGMNTADAVIAVSQFAKNKIIKYYGIPAEKVSVVHNAIQAYETKDPRDFLQKSNPIVLFLGRLTLQKGPDYFISAAQIILHHRPNSTFIVAGSGDMEGRLMQWVASSGLSDKILFTGQLRGEDVDRAYRMADVFVMPSVSEPFGLTALEAIAQGTPVIISKQSGVTEVVSHVLKVDFWDINEMVNKIIGVLDHKELRDAMSQNAHHEVRILSWHSAAQKCIDLYKRIVHA